MHIRGWTLVEFVVILAILLIMGAVLWPFFSGVWNKQPPFAKTSCAPCCPDFVLPRDC